MQADLLADVKEVRYPVSGTPLWSLHRHTDGALRQLFSQGEHSMRDRAAVLRLLISVVVLKTNLARQEIQVSGILGALLASEVCTIASKTTAWAILLTLLGCRLG